MSDQPLPTPQAGDFPSAFPLQLPEDSPVNHVYVHIPFCHRICPYCAFYKHTPADSDLKGFIRALVAEAKLAAASFDLQPQTVYFGGGTPSMLSPSHLESLFAGLREAFDWSAVSEVTFEANPKTFSAKRARFYRELGINRVSLGIQSFDPHTLKILGREHSPEDAIQSFIWLREAGMPSINIDLMFSIPGQSPQTWERSLLTAARLHPDHVSTYNLTYEEDTEFFRQLNAGAMSRDEETDARFFSLSHDILTSHGLRHYETSNFAKPGHTSLHNSAYWIGKNYLGLGPGAVSTIGSRRWSNPSHTPAYSQTLLSNPLAFPSLQSSEPLSPQDWRLERLALMLRMDTGLPRPFLSPDNELASLLDQNLVALVSPPGMGDWIIPTPQGRLLVDELAARL